jgi:hypothetical protein
LPVEIAVPLTRLAGRDVETHSTIVVPGTYIFRVARHACDPGAELNVVIGTDEVAGRS